MNNNYRLSEPPPPIKVPNLMEESDIPSLPNEHNNSYYSWINLETYTFLGCFKKSHIAERLYNKLNNRLNNTKSLLSVYDDIEYIAQVIFRSGQALDSWFYRYHEAASRNEQAKAAYELFHQLLCSEEEASPTQLKELHNLLIEAQQADTLNYYVEFSLAWFNHYFIKDKGAAFKHYINSVNQCLIESCPFVILALRHLACLYQQTGQIDMALKTARDVVALAEENEQIDETMLQLYQFELGLYLAQQGDDEACIATIQPLIQTSSYFYAYTYLTHELADNQAVQQHLQLIHQQKIHDVLLSTEQHWNHLTEKDLKSTQQIPNQDAFQQQKGVYAAMLNDPSMSLLDKKETLNKSLINNSLFLLENEITATAEACSARITENHERWQGVHKLGIRLLYLSGLFLIASIILFVSQPLIEKLLPETLHKVVNWQWLLTSMLAISFIGTITGILLNMARPWGTRKLLKQKNTIDKALKEITNAYNK